MEIKFENRFQINDRDVRCDIKLTPGNLYQIIAGNGEGKTSFLHFLKLNLHKFTPKKAVYVDQQRLSPLNDLSSQDLLSVLRIHRSEELTLFNKYEYLIEQFSKKSINSLSGGQNQLVKILTSLYLSGDLFVFDESFQYLDEKNKNVFLAVLKELKAHGKIVLLVEHQDDLIDKIVDEKIIFNIADKLEIMLWK